MDTTATNDLVAWHCQACGRYLAPRNEKYCPDCGEKMQRCSRYEWFLCDALRTILEHTGAVFEIKEQYPLMDHRGFEWYFDLCVKILNPAPHSEFSNMLIEIDGADHDRQKRYSGPGGGYTRDKDKHWEVFSVQLLHKYGWILSG